MKRNTAQLYVKSGARLSYRQNCESMQRIHISPGLGRRRVDKVTTEDIERLAKSLLATGLAPIGHGAGAAGLAHRRGSSE